MHDALHFDLIASSIAQGEGYGDSALPFLEGPSAFRSPAYPAVLAGAYVLVRPHSWTSGLLVNALLGTAVVALIGIIAAQMFSLRAAAAALGIGALHPTLILFGSSLQLEPLLMALALATLVVALQHRRAPRGLLWPVCAGALLGTAVLAREIAVVLVPVVAWLVWTKRPRSSVSALAEPLIVLVLALMVVAPWTIRNAVRLQAFVPVSTSQGIALAGTYNQSAYSNQDEPAIWIPPWEDPALAGLIAQEPNPTEVKIDGRFRRAALKFIREHPGYLPRVVFWNTIRLFDARGTQDALFVARLIPYPPRLTQLSVYASYVVATLAAVGLMWRSHWRSGSGAVWLVPVLSWMVIAVVSGNIRYRASIEPFTVVLASVAVAGTLSLLGKLHTNPGHWFPGVRSRPAKPE